MFELMKINSQMVNQLLEELLVGKVNLLKADIEKSKSKSDDISKFVSLVDRYSDF